MLIAWNLPTFLWEHAVTHAGYAAYVRKCVLTKPLQGKTPYEAWFCKKPNVSHLQEFGSPVYILLQGSKELPKLLLQSKDHTFERRKLQTKAPVNYRFLNDPFPDEEDETYLTAKTNIYQAYCETPLGGEDPKTLHEAKGSSDWPEWEKAIRVELDQLHHMETWELTDCPKMLCLLQINGYLSRNTIKKVSS